MPEELIELGAEETAGAENEESATSPEQTEESTSENVEEGAEATPAESDSVEATDEGEEGPEEEASPVVEESGAPGAEKRIKQLVGEKHALAEENAYLKGKYESEGKTEEVPAESVPLAAELQSFEAYMEAHPDADHDDYIVDKAEAKILAKEAAKTETARKEAVKTSYLDRLKTSQAAHEDFNAVTFEATPVINRNAALVANIMESEHGPEIQYFLGQNPDELTRIAKLDPLGVSRAIGRIEAALDAPKGATPPKKVIPGAPPPLKTVKGAGAPLPDPLKESSEDWAAKRNKEQYG